MEAHDNLRTGGCLCGAVRFEAAGPARNLNFCHCTSCRRAAGASPVAWGSFEWSRFRLTRGMLSIYQSSPQASRGFCVQCGGALTYRNRQWPAEIDIALASLDEPAALVPAMHIWVQDKLPWVQIADGQPQFATVPPAG